MNLQERLNRMSNVDLVNFLECHNDDKSTQIIESRQIVSVCYDNVHNLPTYNMMGYDTFYTKDNAYHVEFSYHIIKKVSWLFDRYEKAEVTIRDDIFFKDYEDAKLYFIYAKYPSVRLSEVSLLKHLIAEFGEGYNMHDSYMLTLKHVKTNICYAIKYGDNIYFSDADYGSYTPSLKILFETRDMIKTLYVMEEQGEKPNLNLDPKLEFLIRDEIERTEQYLKLLKQIV